MAHTYTPNGPATGYAPSRSPAAMLGAIGIPAGIGAFLIAGLAVTVIDDGEVDSLIGVLIEDETVEILPPPPPDDPVDPVTQTPDPVTTVTKPDPIIVPDTPITVSTFDPGVSTTDLSDMIDTVTIPPLTGIEAIPSPLPTFDPISAKPRNQPSRWVTDRDYKSRWIREGLSGVARFTLQIDANGRVSDCAITRSTGHSVLDDATCTLVSDRARFTPARGSDGAITAGTYSSAVQWSIPE